MNPLMTNAVAFPTTRIPGTPFQQSEGQATRVYKIRKSMAAVQFDQAAKGHIVFLPEGAELCVVGSSRMADFVEVICEERLYNIFEADLSGIWSAPIKSRRVKAIRSLSSAGACA